MKTAVFRKLSATQQRVVNCLMAHDGSYIHESVYYNHNRVVSKDWFTHEYGFETRELMQFSRPTLEVLIRLNVIKSDIDKKHIYTLVK